MCWHRVVAELSKDQSRPVGGREALKRFRLRAGAVPQLCEDQWVCRGAGLGLEGVWMMDSPGHNSGC